MTRIKSVIFDLDGTLVDSAPGIIDCFRQVLADRALNPIRPLNASLIGPPLRDTLRTLTGLADEDPLLDNLAEDFKTHYDDSACHTTPEYAGISSVLKSIGARGISLHIATNKRIIPTRRIVEHLGWNPLFTSIYARDSFTPPLKSKAQLIQRLLVEQALDFQDAIYVGDTQDDGKAALENQMPFWAALWGYGQFDCLEETGFFRLLSKPEDIVRKLALHE